MSAATVRDTGHVTERDCRLRTDKILCAIGDLSDAINKDNGKKSILTRLREAEDRIAVPRYASLSWPQIAKVATVRSTWAVCLMIAVIAVTPVGQRILGRWILKDRASAETVASVQARVSGKN